jgi:hypothetical protein
MKIRKTDVKDLLYHKTKVLTARREREDRRREEWWLRKSVRASFDTSITYPALAGTVIKPSIWLFSTTLGPSVATFSGQLVVGYIGGS